MASRALHSKEVSGLFGQPWQTSMHAPIKMQVSPVFHNLHAVKPDIAHCTPTTHAGSTPGMGQLRAIKLACRGIVLLVHAHKFTGGRGQGDDHGTSGIDSGSLAQGQGGTDNLWHTHRVAVRLMEDVWCGKLPAPACASPPESVPCQPSSFPSSSDQALHACQLCKHLQLITQACGPLPL